MEEYGIGFDGLALSFNAILLVNIIQLIGAIIYWVKYHFSFYLFWCGIIGSILNTLGVVICNEAFQIGPLGPIQAISTMSNIFLVAIEALKHQRLPTTYEFIALILGLGGVLELVIPHVFRRLFCPCCCKETTEEEDDDKILEHQQKLSLNYRRSFIFKNGDIGSIRNRTETAAQRNPMNSFHLLRDSALQNKN